MSKLINKTRLQKFAEGFWDKVKRRYDNAFVDAEIPATEKKIKFTKANSTIKDVSLEKYARLQDRNAFEKDVSVDNVGVVDNSHIGTTTSVTSIRRGLGFRQLTTNAFKDGYVDHIKIYLGDNATGNTTWKVWAITKGTDRTQDSVNAVAFSGNLSIETVQENGQAKKIVNIPINTSYATETYFIVRSTTHDMLVVDGISQKYRNDSVNLGDTNQPQDTAGSPIDWGSNAEGANTAIMYLYGRESIGSLAEKLRQTQADSSLYVKHSDCINGTEQGEKAGKVVKLGTDGKLHSSLMPAIAINEFISVSGATWQESIITREYQNGDVIFHTNTQKRYLCVDTTQPFDNGRFVELNSKDGTVTSVDGKTGAVTLNIALEDNKFKLKINGTGGTETVKEIEMISEQDITDILSNLQ